MKEKLELKHIAPYLAYDVGFKSSMDEACDVIFNNKKWTLDGINKLFGDYCLLTKENNDAYDIKTCKLILRPLSDLTKEIEHNSEKFVPIERLTEDFDKYGENGFDFSYLNKSPINYPYYIVQKLFEWHFDVFGLIDKGLAISYEEAGL